MRAGQLDQRLTIQRESNTSDGMGGDTVEWCKVQNVWANVSPASGNEKEFGGQLTGEYTNVFTIRNNKTILDSDRIVWDGDFYNIRAIAKEGGRKLYLVIAAERGVAV